MWKSARHPVIISTKAPNFVKLNVMKFIRESMGLFFAAFYVSRLEIITCTINECKLRRKKGVGLYGITRMNERMNEWKSF